MSLPTNYRDDILNADVNTLRKYRMINNPDGTVSFEDVTEYLTRGSELSGGDINEQNRVINQIDTKCSALDDNLTANNQKFKYGFSGDRYGYYVGNVFHPFRPPHTTTFTPTARGIVDMGEDHTHRYVDTSDITSPMTHFYDSGVIQGGTGGNATTSWTATKKCFVVASGTTLGTNWSSASELNTLASYITANNLSLVNTLKITRNNNGTHASATKVFCGIVNAGTTVSITANNYGYGATSVSLQAFSLT